MTYSQFCVNLNSNIMIGQELKNPGKGISTIKSINDDVIRYIRGKSTIKINISEIYDNYLKFKGKKCSTGDLKKLKPQVFDSKANGHSCNCTFLFMILKEMNLVNGIEGNGRRGSEFFVNIH